MGRGALAWWGLGSVLALTLACLPDLPTILCGNGRIDPLETCDPGNLVRTGCNALCQIDCPGVVDSSSGHCYLGVSGGETFDNAVSTCNSSMAHVVTFVDDAELEFVTNFFSPGWPKTPRVWAGQYSESGPSPPYFATSSNEPGWNGEACSGCFLHDVTDFVVPPLDGGVEAGFSSAIALVNPSRVNSYGSVGVVGQNAKSQVVCEIEPPGSRSTACYAGDGGAGAFCFDILATASSGKRYVYHPSPATAVAADAYCKALTDGGASSLVVFTSRAEREQVIYELSQLGQIPNDPATLPTELWIGLKSTIKSTPGGGRPEVEWIWEDGVAASASSTGSRPSVWGNGMPPTVNSTVYAYINLTGNYDTGLAYANADGAKVYAYPFVCQY